MDKKIPEVGIILSASEVQQVLDALRYGSTAVQQSEAYVMVVGRWTETKKTAEKVAAVWDEIEEEVSEPR